MISCWWERERERERRSCYVTWMSWNQHCVLYSVDQTFDIGFSSKCMCLLYASTMYIYILTTLAVSTHVPWFTHTHAIHVVTALWISLHALAGRWAIFSELEDGTCYGI